MGKKKKFREGGMYNGKYVRNLDSSLNRTVLNEIIVKIRDAREMADYIKGEFPHLRIFSEAHLWTSDSCISECGDDQCSPEMEMDWEDLIEKLDSIGLEIRFKKGYDV